MTFLLTLLFFLVALAFIAISIRLERVSQGFALDAGDRYRQLERTYGAILDFLLDNPEIAENATVRETLLPNSDDLRDIGFHWRFEAALREVRAGRPPYFSDRARAGASPSMRIVVGSRAKEVAQ